MSLFNRFRASKPTFSAPLQPDEPFFAVGDIHGRADLLSPLFSVLQKTAPAIDTPVIFVGDYIDRGDESLEVLRWLHELQQEAGEQVICLRGNHEEMLLNFLKAPTSAGPRWVRHGGLQTLAGLRIAPPGSQAKDSDWESVRDQLLEAMGPSLVEWLKALPLSWISGNIAVVHAGADPALPINEQAPDVLTWGHPAFTQEPRQDGIWVVHGHTIHDQPDVTNGRIAIDTGAYATGRLTTALVQSGTLDFYKA